MRAGVAGHATSLTPSLAEAETSEVKEREATYTTLSTPPFPHHRPSDEDNCVAMSQTQQVQHADSIESQDPNLEDKKKKVKSRRPASASSSLQSFLGIGEQRVEQQRLTITIFRHCVSPAAIESMAVRYPESNLRSRLASR